MEQVESKKLKQWKEDYQLMQREDKEARKIEQYSQQEYREMMGEFLPRYRRSGGSIKSSGKAVIR